MGGVVAQEILKGVTHKFIPIRQWYYPDTVEVIPDKQPIEDFLPVSQSRSSHNAMCIGRSLLDGIAKLKFVIDASVCSSAYFRLFMIGAGAVGCELLKNYAMLGVGVAEQGGITVTDPDVIENSNLNRQVCLLSSILFYLIQSFSSCSASVICENQSRQLQR
jgi:hypothetical protein